MTTEARLEQVESELADVTTRLRRLEDRTGMEFFEPAPEPTPAMEPDRDPVPPTLTPAPIWAPGATLGSAPRRPAASSPRSALDLEALFGGRVLAWIGGLAILFGAVLFLGMAISRGWLDEETRTIIAAAVSLAALFGGIWLHDREGRTEAAKALVGSAISGLFGTIVVATQAYSLISPELGLVFGAAVAAAGFGIAIRWRSSLVAAIGSLGALGTPIMTGVGASGTGIAFVALALAATAAILVWQRWDWLALGAFVVSAPQLLDWTLNYGEYHLVLGIAVPAGFWLLYATAALGYELRTRGEKALPVASWLLLLGSCVAFVGPGYWILDYTDHHTAAVVLLFGFSAVQVGLGAFAIGARIHRELGSLLIGIGIALAAFGLGESFHGPALVVAWAAGAAALAALASRLDATPDPNLSPAERMMVAAGAFLGLAIVHTLIHEAPPSAIFDGVRDLGDAMVAIGACAAATFAGAWFIRRISPDGARAATFAGATALVYLGSVLIVATVGVYGLGETREAGQTWLSAFWTATGLGAVVVGLVRRAADLRLAGLALLAVAIGKVWTYDLSELDELSRVLSFIGLGFLLLVGAFAYQRIKPEGERSREVTR